MWLWAWNDEDEEDERLANDTPPTPELRELKQLFDHALAQFIVALHTAPNIDWLGGLSDSPSMGYGRMKT